MLTDCTDSDVKQKTLFKNKDIKKAGIDFINQLDQTEELNTYTYRNFYNGAGVAVGDINNDGLLDIYFCGNTRDNRLYLNKGNFKFEDITESSGAGCRNVWSTGVSMVDINADGYLDIYVCKSGLTNGFNRHNELFINNGDLTFTEKSKEYGLDIIGLSIQATFFDYDNDGDLDCYLLNNSIKSIDSFEPEKGLREIFDTDGANMLLRNDNLKFTNVTRESGIYSSKISFGLGATVTDINKDNWPDLYISNDFFERDYLYINNQDGTFVEVLELQIRETSMGAMGADIADLNNDGYAEIYVTEMTAEDNARLKTKTVYQSWENYQINLQNGYYHQFARNTLQLNNQNNTFSEIGRYAGVHHTDWSWGALIFDMDHDGFKDIFVANGIYKDLLDRDYLDFYANPRNVRSVFDQSDEGIIALINKMPSVKVSNYAFTNNKNLTFTNQSKHFGLDTPGFSNGAAYADFDNDGDLDLVVNNINMAPFLYENLSESHNQNNFITVILQGDKANPQAVGSKVTVYAESNLYYQELFPVRGFLSTVDARLNFGIGTADYIDSVVVCWPDGKVTSKSNIQSNQFLTIEKANDSHEKVYSQNSSQKIFIAPADLNLPDIKHNENDFVDFDRYNLLFHMRSNEGPRVCVGDVNGDGKDDFYICGAKGSPGKLLIQTENGFVSSNELLFMADSLSEETDCIFFDADNDGDLDLYVACGGLEFPSSSSALIDRLYINNGNGIFSKSTQILPSFTFESTSCVRASDFDGDGDIDLFVGVRMRPFAYGIAPGSYLLINDGKGFFSDKTNEKAADLKDIGHVTDACWVDIDQDGDEDLMIIGEWMPITLLLNMEGKYLQKASEFTGLENSNGWWHVLKSVDIDNDGDMDFVAGNHGLNSRFKASINQPVSMYVNDFDLNGSIEQIITTYQNGIQYPMPMKPDMVKQMPTLTSRIKTFEDYKDLTLDSIFDNKTIEKSIVYQAFNLETSIIMNLGGGKFEVLPLPSEAQLSPVYSILLKDWNNDGFIDILIGGNQMRAKPEVGTYQAGYGLYLVGIDGKTFKAVLPSQSGISIPGEIRDFDLLHVGNKEIIIVARNDNELIYLMKNERWISP
jgi:enediyne biosynthesis protein E4